MIAILTAIKSHRTWKALPFQKLEVEVYMSVHDATQLVNILVDWLQIASQGPHLEAFGFIAEFVSSCVTLDIVEIFGFDISYAYVNQFVSVGISYFWILLVVAILFRWEFSGIKILQKIGELSFYITPIIGSFLFLPIIQNEIEAYICVEAYDVNKDGTLQFTESFMQTNCFEECWKGRHLSVAILTSFAVILYMPTAILLKPMWQELKGQLLRIRYRSSYITLLAFFKVVIVTFDKGIGQVDTTTHAFIYFILMACFTIYTYRQMPCTYDKVNVLNVVAYICISYYAFLSILITYTESEQEAIWVLILISGCLVILLVGFFVQRRYPKLIIVKKLDVTGLYRWAFQIKTQQKYLDQFKEQQIEENKQRRNTAKQLFEDPDFLLNIQAFAKNKPEFSAPSSPKVISQQTQQKATHDTALNSPVNQNQNKFIQKQESIWNVQNSSFDNTAEITNKFQGPPSMNVSYAEKNQEEQKVQIMNIVNIEEVDECDEN